MKLKIDINIEDLLPAKEKQEEMWGYSYVSGPPPASYFKLNDDGEVIHSKVKESWNEQPYVFTANVNFSLKDANFNLQGLKVLLVHGGNLTINGNQAWITGNKDLEGKNVPVWEIVKKYEQETGDFVDFIASCNENSHDEEGYFFVPKELDEQKIFSKDGKIRASMETINDKFIINVKSNGKNLADLEEKFSSALGIKFVKQNSTFQSKKNPAK